MGITSISIIMNVVVLNFHYCSPLNKRDLPTWLKRLTNCDKNSECRSNTAVPAFDDFCAQYYRKTNNTEGANCHRSSFDANHRTNLSPTVNLTDISNEDNTNADANWFDAVPTHHSHHHQQPFSISNSVAPIGQPSVNKPNISGRCNNKRTSSRVSKSKWMGQVDRLAASLFASSSSANKPNKVHCTEHNCTSANSSGALHRRTNAGASGNWAQSTESHHANYGDSTIDSRYLTGQIGAAVNAPTCTHANGNNSSAFQVRISYFS